MSQRPRALVTGASGFVGARLTERLSVEHATDVHAGVRRFGGAGNLARCRATIIPIGGFTSDELDAAVTGCEVVYHCAQDWADPHRNPEMARELVKAVARAGGRRVVYLGSIATYFPTGAGVITEQQPWNATEWTYAVGKREASDALLAAAREHGIEATVLEPTCVYGPFSSWAIAPAQHLRLGRVVVPPADEGTCNLLYIDDLVDAMIGAAAAPDAAGERFIVSGPGSCSWPQLYGAIADALGTGEIVEMTAAEVDGLLAPANPAALARRFAIDPRWVLTSRPLAPVRAVGRHVLGATRWQRARDRGPSELVLPGPEDRMFRWCRSVVSSDKAAKAFGFAPKVSVSQGLARTAAFVRWANL